MTSVTAPTGPSRRSRAFVALLLAASLIWLGLILAAPVAARPHGRMVPVGRHGSRVVYLVGSRICHQRADRSFLLAGTPLPVCARCVGLYAGAPLGLAAAALAGVGSRRRPPASSRVLVIAAALPTVITLATELALGFSVPAALRALSALPLSAAVAWVIATAVRAEA